MDKLDRIRDAMASVGVDSLLMAGIPSKDANIYYSTEFLVFSKFKVYEISRDGEELVVKASGWGEKFDERKHEPKVEVKAATYSQMFIGKVNGKWVARFVLDI